MGIACVIALWATLAIEARRGQGRAAEQWAGAVFGGVVLAVLAYNAWTLIQVIYL